MSQVKHTPGPWLISGVSMNDGSISIRQDKYRIVIAYTTNAASLGDFVSAAMRGRTDFGAPDTAETQWANARLIAAAPDMLEALHDILTRPTDGAARERVRAVIAKAEGHA